MRPATINKLCCPFDKADLNLTATKTEVDGNVLEGFFTCSSCNRVYPIVRGVPIMNPDEYREFKLEQPILEKYAKQLKGAVSEDFRLIPNTEKALE
ncbi:Trm112 family protein [Roseivirga pacifica]|tara:strand:- start:618 stop:905 length:288 start_codon:yes stop_codon:yes gene_type:complete